MTTRKKASLSVDDIAAAILSVTREERRVCTHKLMEVTGLPLRELAKGVNRLLELNKLRGISLDEDNVIYEGFNYTPINPYAYQGLMDGYLSPLVGLTQEEVLTRLHMLRRMKAQLIVDWHPVLDKIIGDYERDMRRVEREKDPYIDLEDGEFHS